MAKKTNKPLVIGIIIATVVVLAVLAWLAFRKPDNEETTDGEITDNKTYETPSGGSSVPKKETITNETVLEWKDPLIKADQVLWIQDAYNRVARKMNSRPSATKWEIITEDGIFGKQTHNAIAKVTGGVRKISWTDFKIAAEKFVKQYFPCQTLYDNKTEPCTVSGAGGTW
jgi:hypothetical protein